MQQKTSTGLAENVAGLLCYVGWWITGLIFLLIEQQNRFVRFHAMQSIIVLGSVSLASFILGWIPIIGGFLSFVLWIIGVVLWIVLMIRAYQGVYYKVPGAGDLAEKWLGSQGQGPAQ